jgi:hypothetical protein
MNEKQIWQMDASVHQFLSFVFFFYILEKEYSEALS